MFEMVNSVEKLSSKYNLNELPRVNSGELTIKWLNDLAET